MEDPDQEPDPYKQIADLDADPGGPKTYPEHCSKVFPWVASYTKQLNITGPKHMEKNVAQRKISKSVVLHKVFTQ
jgi:hypothetical protein